MKYKYSFLAIVLPLAVGIPTASATTIFFDTFTDGDRADGADLTDVAWHQTATTSISTIINSGGSELTGNTLAFDSNGSTFRGIHAAFPTILLAVGDVLTLTFDIRMIAGNNISSAMRWGIGNSNSNPYTGDGSPTLNSSAARSHFGYFSSVGTGSNNSLGISKDPGGDTSTPGFTNGTAETFGTSTNGGLDIATNQSVLFSITRSSLTQVSITSQVFSTIGSTGTPTNSIVNALDPNTTAAFFSFNQVTLATGNNSAIDFNVDNIKLTHTPIPEPRAALLGGLGVLALLRRRR